MKYFSKKLLSILGAVLLTFFTVTAKAQTNFCPLADGPPGENIDDFLVINRGNIFFRTKDRDAFQSTDNGKRWSMLTGGLTNKEIYSLLLAIVKGIALFN